MSKIEKQSFEKEPFIFKSNKTISVPIKDSAYSVAIPDEKFQELLDHIDQINRIRGGIANPGALGLGAFALTTFILSVFNSGIPLIDMKLEPVVLPVALFYGGLAQLLAGMWEFKINNTFGGTAFTSYGAFWLSFAGYVHIILPHLKEIGNAKHATGLFLLAWFIFTIIMNVAAGRISKFLFILFSILNLTFFLLIIGNLADLELLINMGGLFGIITSFIAWYGCAAIVINSTFPRPMLPLGTYA